jgi:two-component system chemotaxis sensor kinase CheA
VRQQLASGLSDLERTTRDLQESVMSIRMIPMGEVFNRFPRMLRDLAARLGKQLELRTVGEATELDKGLIEKITDPLTHLVRNSVDHGIEMPAEPLAQGKPEHGTITMSARHEGGCIVIEVSDDGRGLDRDKLLAKARERGMQLPDGMSDNEVYHLIFAPGFSTAEAVTDISGRGVGMDVVRRNILRWAAPSNSTRRWAAAPRCACACR